MKIDLYKFLICIQIFTSFFAIAQASSERMANTVILDETGVKNLNIKTVEVEETEFETTIFAIGRVDEIPSGRSVLSTRIAGRVVGLNVFEGDRVNLGDALVTVESRQMGDPPPIIELNAAQSGLIVASHVRVGQPVEPDTELMDISDRSRMWAVAKIPEQEAAYVHIGSLAHIRIPALGNKIINASLVRFGVKADPQAGTIEGIFELDNSDNRLSPGMRAEFSIVLKHRPNVLVVPREAIQGDPTKRVVFVKDFEIPNAFVRCPVVLGEKNEEVVEILSGLFPGDEVVTQGAYSLAFAGGGSGPSLKEALDAAHGHEHNEDGTEITPGQKNMSNDQKIHISSENETDKRIVYKILIIYSIIMTFLSIVVFQLYMNKTKQNGLNEVC